ncbi:CheR family methyltransferase [Salinisphaera aquimarina]|uniref:histidine kinase n=1 Tax=Salinisphaera aquimarina TaxID=2094031 RepID=A0ABV7ERU3_9GAMM
MSRIELPSAHEPPGASLPVVIVGASAGGLKQLQTLFRALSPDTGAAFVVLLHLAPKQRSHLDEILGNATKLDVVAIEDGMTLEADRVHVIPSGQRLTLDGDTLRLYSDERHSAMTGLIDEFLQNVAREKGTSAVGIILSGSGSDGALGLKAIKAMGGLTMVQEPINALHDGMPRTAIEAALPDYVLDTVELVAPLENHLRLNFGADSADDDAGAVADDALDQVLAVLQSRERNHNFAHYKPAMLKRRIRRRMGMNGIRRLPQYLELLNADSAECERLGQDFLISVTEFFRDPATYETLKKTVIEPLLDEHKTNDPLRIWIPGCATGEEAYSVAICVAEAIAAIGTNHQFTVFASDIDRRALEFARAGVYPEAIATVVSEQRLRTFFDRMDHHYQIKPSLRERVVFAIQNVTEDPPYSSLDLVSCRNLLMYMQPSMQRRVLGSFHFALKNDGFLLLGNAETVGGQVDLFETVVKEQRLFRRIGPKQRNRLDSAFPTRSPRRGSLEPRPAQHPPPDDDVEGIARDVLLQDHVPAAVLINRKLEILCGYGPTGDYLSLPFGQSSLALMEMVHSAYRSAVRAATHRAFRDDRMVKVNAALKTDDAGSLTITARPLHRPDCAHGLMLVIFEPVVAHVPALDRSTGENTLERQLSDELDATRHDLNSTIQALEASNEDLKSSNEEILSMNEELQSSNEELETSKEELQSVNEELTTVNGELENKLEELETAHNDLHNLFSGTQMATLFLDRSLCIKRFTPTVKALLSVIDSDVGRPLSDITFKFDDAELLDDADRVLEELSIREREIEATDGSWYLRRVLPYRTRVNSIEGVVITFTDINALKQAAQATQDSEQRLDLALGTINGGIWDMTVDPHSATATDHVYISARLKGLLGFDDKQLPNSLASWHERIAAEDRVLFQQVRTLKIGEQPVIEYRARHRNGGIRWFSSQSRVISDGEGRPVRWIGIDYDITEAKQIELRSRRARAQLQLLADALPQMLVYVDSEHEIRFSNRMFNDWFKLDAENVVGRNLSDFIGPQAAASQEHATRSALSGNLVSGNLVLDHPAGDTRTIDISYVPHAVDGNVLGYYALMVDVTHAARRDTDRMARQSGLVMLQRMATIGEMSSTLAHDMRQPLSAINNFAGALMRMLHADKPTDQIVPVLRKIADQVSRANNIVDVTRTFVGRSDEGAADTDLNTLVHSALSLTEGMARERNIDRRLNLHTPLPRTHCHSVQLEQVIVNLLINGYEAMDAVPRDARIMTIGTAISGDDGRVRISVTDSGDGIPADKIGRIFDTFYTSKLEGMGLGLALGRSIAENHGGSLWAESSDGNGATFFLELPTIDGEHVDDEHTGSDQSAPR